MMSRNEVRKIAAKKSGALILAACAISIGIIAVPASADPAGPVETLPGDVSSPGTSLGDPVGPDSSVRPTGSPDQRTKQQKVRPNVKTVEPLETPEVAPLATAWCGNYLADPAVSNNFAWMTVTDVMSKSDGSGYRIGQMVLEETYYSGRYFAFTQMNTGVNDTTPALIWKYYQNNATYECPEYNDYENYTSGVSDIYATVVQAKHYYPNGVQQYGPAVTFR